MIKDPHIFLQHILESIVWIETEIAGLTEQQFRSVIPIQDAVIRRLEIIGEATKHLPDHLKNDYPEIAWQDMAGMRDVLIHDYFGVNVKTVWSTVTRDLPILKEAIQTMLQAKAA